MDRVLVAAFAAVVAATVAFGSMRLALGEVLGVEYGSLLLAGLPVSAFFLGRSMSATISGFVYDSSPVLARRLPGASLLGVALVVYAMSVYTREPVILIALSGVQGLLAGLVWPLVQTSVARHSRGSPVVLSAYFAAGSTGIAVGRFLYPHLASLLGVSSVFRLAAASYAVAGLVLLYGLEGLELGWGSRGGRRGSRLPRLASAWRVLLVNASSGYMVGFDSQMIYPYLVTAKHLDSFTASYALSAAAVLGIAVKLGAGLLAERVGLRASLAILASSAASSLAAAALGDGVIAAVGAAAYLSVASGVVPLARLAAYLEGERLGSPAGVVGVSNTFSNIGSLIAPLSAAAHMSAGVLPAYPAPLLASALLAPPGRRTARGGEGPPAGGGAGRV